MHQPLLIEPAGARTIVILIHGFMGSPRQMDYLAQVALNRNCAVSVPLLPGHGGSAKSFGEATAVRWLEHVFAEIDRCRRRYENIYLVGHSMGCLLVLHGANRFSEKIRGLMLIACPLVLRPLSLEVVRIRMAQLFYERKHPMKAAYMEGSSVRISPALLRHSHRPSQELRRLMKDTAPILPQITAPVIAVYALKDEVVSLKSSDVLRSGLVDTTLNEITLSEALHSYYPEEDRRQIISQFEVFLAPV